MTISKFISPSQTSSCIVYNNKEKRKAKEEKKKEKKVLKSFGVLTYMLTAFTDNLYYFMCTEFISKQP